MSLWLVYQRPLASQNNIITNLNIISGRWHGGQYPGDFLVFVVDGATENANGTHSEYQQEERHVIIHFVKRVFDGAQTAKQLRQYVIDVGKVGNDD